MDLEQGRYYRGIDHLAEAEKCLKDIHPDAWELTRIERARGFTLIGWHEKAKSLIEPLDGLSDTNICLRLEISQIIEQKTGNLPLALELAQKRLDKLIEMGDQAASGWALQNIGYIQTCLGNLDAAVSVTDQGLTESIKSEDQTLSYFLLCNKAAIRRCSGLNYDKLISAVKDFAKKHNLHDLSDFTQEVEQLPCIPSS